MEMNILFQNRFVRVLEKPPKTHYDELIPINSNTWKNWRPAHRLDFETSGAIVFTHKDETDKFRKDINNPQKIKKVYLAGLETPLLELENSSRDMLYTEGFIASRYKSSKKVQFFNHDHPPNPRFWKSMQPVSAQFFKPKDPAELDPLNIFSKYIYRVHLETGARHQIRATLAHLNSPILGDPLYGNSKETNERMQLHSYKIEISESLWGEAISVTCPLRRF
jgi:23S rRNA-/tRNA-specific pseudouridylate synthase